MRIKLILTLLAGVMLAGCETSDKYVWLKPIALSPRVEQAFEDYKDKVTNKGVFAVSEDGRAYGVSYCAVGAQCRGNPQIIAIRACEQRSRGYTCKVYAIGSAKTAG